MQACDTRLRVDLWCQIVAFCEQRREIEQQPRVGPGWRSRDVEREGRSRHHVAAQPVRSELQREHEGSAQQLGAVARRIPGRCRGSQIVGNRALRVLVGRDLHPVAQLVPRYPQRVVQARPRGRGGHPIRHGRQYGEVFRLQAIRGVQQGVPHGRVEPRRLGRLAEHHAVSSARCVAVRVATIAIQPSREPSLDRRRAVAYSP